MHHSNNLEKFAKFLMRENTLGGDLTLDAAKHLALAWAAINELKKTTDITVQGKSLVLSELERAWAQLMYIRSTVPPETLDTTTISKLGRVVLENKISDTPNE